MSPGAEDDRPTAIFLHLPKTGGSTLHRIMERQYPDETIYSIGLPIPERLKVFKALPAEERAAIRMLRGHMEFGLHEWIPRPAVYTTILREPLERSLSHYSRARSRGRTGGMGLVEFLDSGRRIDLDNGQTRWLSGDGFVPYGSVAPQMLERAKANLETFAAVGLQERFEESVLLIAEALGWIRPLVGRSANVTPGRTALQDLTPEERGALSRRNELDEALYRFAVGLFERQLEAAGPNLARRARRLRRVARAVDALPGPRRKGGGAR
ncbi:MAG: hypothetical protein LC722_04135 [Actinobacteria bacterium]|nr:hypothetical protein [Actinomycetota bacterium]